MYNELKLEIAVMSHEQQLMRQWKNKYKQKAKKYKGNYPVWRVRIAELDKERGALRTVIRYSHLASALVRGRPYLTVENSVREGNEVCPQELLSYLNNWGFFPDINHVKNWLEG
jgi:hypothetical protein